MYQKYLVKNWRIKCNIVILIFDFEIYTNLFIASLLADKVHKSMTTIISALLNDSFILKEAQSLIVYISHFAL